jgi:O-antigen/teichoic acid export membrane protein
VLLKFLASQFGPSAFGELTQIMGVAAIFYMFAGGGISSGLIRNLSATGSDSERQSWLSAAVTINILASALLAIVAIVLALLGGGAVFGDPTYRFCYFAIALGQIFVGMGNLVCAYLSGVGRNRTYASIHIVANLLSLLLLVASTLQMGFTGAVFGVVIGPATIGVVAVWVFYRSAEQKLVLRPGWIWPRLKNLLSFGAVSAFAVTSVPVAQLIIRRDMGNHLGWDVVGYWQAVTKLSDACMLFIGVVFINFLLPRLSRQRSDADAIRSLIRFGSILLPACMLGGGAIYLARDYVIPFVYSRQFQPASELVLPQVVGDMLKITALLLHYYFMSRGRVAIILISELMQGVLLYGFYRVFAQNGGLAPVYSHVATYSLLLILMLGLLYSARNPGRDIPQVNAG